MSRRLQEPPRTWCNLITRAITAHIPSPWKFEWTVTLEVDDASNRCCHFALVFPEKVTEISIPLRDSFTLERSQQRLSDILSVVASPFITYLELPAENIPLKPDVHLANLFPNLRELSYAALDVDEFVKVLNMVAPKLQVLGLFRPDGFDYTSHPPLYLQEFTSAWVNMKKLLPRLTTVELNCEMRVKELLPILTNVAPYLGTKILMFPEDWEDFHTIETFSFRAKNVVDMEIAIPCWVWDSTPVAPDYWLPLAQNLRRAFPRVTKMCVEYWDKMNEEMHSAIRAVFPFVEHKLQDTIDEGSGSD